MPVTSDQIKDLIAIDQAAKVVDQDQSIAVAIQRNADSRTDTGHGELQQSG